MSSRRFTVLRMVAVAVAMFVVFMASTSLRNGFDLPAELMRANLTARSSLKGSLDDGRCRVATQGKLLVADSKGRVCERFDQDTKTECCLKRIDLDCGGNPMGCFEFYEQCVGCCMGWDSFDACSLGCRTNSDSLDEHQEYREPPERRHCFGPVDEIGRAHDERRKSMQQTTTPQPTRWPSESERPPPPIGGAEYEWLEI